MFRLILILIAALILLPIGSTHAQTRDFGAHRYWLDDNNGHRLLLQFLGPTDGVVTFPSGASTTIGLGGSPFQTLRWNGSAWVPASNLLNDDTNITLTGQLISLAPDGMHPSSSYHKRSYQISTRICLTASMQRTSFRIH